MSAAPEPATTTGRLQVNRKLCIGTALCSSMHPELFTLTDGYGHPLTDALTSPETVEAALEAVECCPREAITLHHAEEPPH